MRLFIFLLLITFLPPLAYADDLDTQINKACLRHAVSLVARLKSEVVGELSQSQSDKALQLASESCQVYFKKEFNQDIEALSLSQQQNTGDKEEQGATDWFTEKILSGDSSRKEGNKRLKRIK